MRYRLVAPALCVPLRLTKPTHATKYCNKPRSLGMPLTSPNSPIGRTAPVVRYDIRTGYDQM